MTHTDKEKKGSANFLQKMPGGHCYYCHEDYPDKHDYEACKTINAANYHAPCDERCKDSKFYGAFPTAPDTTFHSGVVTVASGLDFEEDRKGKLKAAAEDLNNRFTEVMRDLGSKAEVGEWEKAAAKIATKSFAMTASYGRFSAFIYDEIKALYQRAYEEGKAAATDLEAIRQTAEMNRRVGFEAGKQAMYESIYSRDVQAELREEGKQAMRQELREKVASLKAGSDFNPNSQLGDEDIRRGWNRALDNISDFLKDTGSSNK